MAKRVSRWLRGHVSASASGSYVRISLEREYGSLRAEVYLTRTQARDLRDAIDWTLHPKRPAPEEETP